MKYIANPVEVEAFKITGVTLTGPGEGSVTVETDGGGSRIADAGMTARYFPLPGDYWVIQSDGYEYLNPKNVFERKYSPFPGAAAEG